MSDPWREGKYLDLWSVVHLHAGFLLGWLLFRLGLSIVPTVGWTLLALASYEVVELVAGVKERASNRLVDVGVGLVGLALADRVRAVDLEIVVPLVATSFAVLNLAGWLAWRRRTRES
jgi:uncharacterized membrane protein YuzA (DUF378 family)